MRITWLGVATLATLFGAACAKHSAKPTCGHGIDPSSPECNKPQCSDGIDNDGDGLVDYPNDPGCFSPLQDSELDDCFPTVGPNCPECGDHVDNDGNGLTDFAGGDPGCTSAAGTLEYTKNPKACGDTLTVEDLPTNHMVMGQFAAGSVVGPIAGKCDPTGGQERVFLLYLEHPKVVVASTDNMGTDADTVLFVRGAACTDPASEVACNDDVSNQDNRSTVQVSLDRGTYYLVLQSHSNETSGNYVLTVDLFVGEGEPCQSGDECGPGLVCRTTAASPMQKVCAKHECQDGLDNDGDGKVDYPNDPGCASPEGDSEMDDCFPTVGAACPMCANKIDDNANGKIDYPAEPNCASASSASEFCHVKDNVFWPTSGMITDDTTGAHSDYALTCAFSTPGGPNRTYRLDLPALTQLDATLTTSGNASWTPLLALFDHTCAGTALQCSSSASFTQATVAAGTYYLVVGGGSNTDYGPYTLAVTGTIANGGSCEGALAQSGALTCGAGYACKGTAGSRTCKPSQCNDGIDNNGDGKIDYPNDPGCTDPSDDTEDTVCPGANCPVCANGVDDNHNTRTDWPAEWGCSAASGSSEDFCTGEHDVKGLVTKKTYTGTTTGASADLTPSCGFSSSPDVSYALQLPVKVQSLQVDTIGSAFDTILTVRDANCAMPIACDDDSGGNLTSKITLTNIDAGGYALNINGSSTANGNYTLNVHGTVAHGTPCSSPLFQGTTPVLSCPTGSMCTGTPAKCS